MTNHIIPDHHVRFDSELAAITANEESHGKINCTVTGLDNIGRNLTMVMTRQNNGNVLIDLSANIKKATPFSSAFDIGDPERLLPVTRRMTALCRRAQNKEDLLLRAISLLAETTSAQSAAAIEWRGEISKWPIKATLGSFDENLLQGVFRSSVIGRLSRGDVIVKESLTDASDSEHSLIIIPLMASKTPEGIVILYVDGYSVLIPQEHQSFGLLGEIIGLGLRALTTLESNTYDYHQSRASDIEASIALGRLSARMSHEINNAATVLSNNITQIISTASAFSRNSALDIAHKDSIHAVKTIQNLTDALRSFAPEETSELESADLLKILEMVVASVKFYAKQGINVTISRSKTKQIRVKCHSHYLIRALFLIFVELVESALASGRVLQINMAIQVSESDTILTITVSSGSLKVPTVLISQLERDGVVSRNILKAGAKLNYNIQGEKFALTLTMQTNQKQSQPSHQARPSRLPSARSSRLPARRGTILIVDDDSAIIRSTRRLLENNHDVLAANSGQEALKVLKENPDIDVVLLDIFMPQMSGFDVYETLKRQNSPIIDRVVFVTGGATNQEVARHLIQSNCPLIEKPLNIPQLNRLIMEMIAI
jgi:CheY-like chemotaxis protein